MKYKTCKLCKKTITGRSDKMFCGIDCKNSYNMQLRQVTNIATTKTDRILHRNRSIILEIIGKNTKQKKINKSQLDNKRFNYTHITGYHLNSKGKMVHHLYDFSYAMFSDQGVIIYRRQ